MKSDSSLTRPSFSQPSSKAMTRFLAPWTFALLLLVGTATELHAQSSATNETVKPWARTVAHNLAKELASSDADRRTDAMVQVVKYGTFGDGTILWDPVVQPLLSIYETDDDYRSRHLALAALHATGDPIGMKRLRSLVHDESSSIVQRATMTALVDHYGVSAVAADRSLLRLAESLLEGKPGSAPGAVFTSTEQQ